MRAYPIAPLVLSCLMLPALIRPAAAEEAAAVETVIADQLEAFRARDVPRAWDHASPMIRGLFGTPQNFARMVEQGYPMVWSPGGYRFVGLREDNGRMKERVLIRDGNGLEHALDYEMVQTENGWKINAVTFAPAPVPVA